MYYIHKDYLGSYQTITDSAGQVVERLSFDPWGRRRNAQTWTFNNVPSSYLFDRGFTGHEHMDHFALINMGGRVYDPVLGNFLSPDPFVQAPANPQNYNRYGYALNNPLKYTDPTGYQTASAPGAVSWLGGGGGWGESSREFGGNVNWDYFANLYLYTNWQGKQVGFMDTPINLDPGQDAGITYTGEEAKNMFIRMFSPGIQTHIYVFFGKIYVVISDGPPGEIYGSEEKGFYTSDPSKTAVSTGEASVTGKAGNGGVGTAEGGGPNWFSNNFRFDFSNSFGFEVTELYEYKGKIVNPLGMTTVRHFSHTSFGNGTINIIHNALSGEIYPAFDYSFGLGSVSFDTKGFSISIGVRNNLDVGINQDGFMIGYSSKRNGVISGTDYSWRPSNLWYIMATSPYKFVNPILVY